MATFSVDSDLRSFKTHKQKVMELSSLGRYAYFYLSKKLLNTRDTFKNGSKFYGLSDGQWQILILLAALSMKRRLSTCCICNGGDERTRIYANFIDADGCV